MSSLPNHTAVPWPMIRNAVLSTLSLHRKHTMFGLVEADVTDAMQKIADLRRTHRIVISLHIYVMYCLSRVLVEHAPLNTYKRGNRLITFNDVDVATTAEKRMPDTGVRYAAGLVVRAVQSMSLAALNLYMREAMRRDPTKDETVVMRRKFARLPGFVRWLIGKRVAADPFLFKKIYGTVALTSLQIPDVKQSYIAIPPNIHTLTVARGGLTERYVLGPDGLTEKRKFVPLTLAIDHAIVDGIVSARLARALVHRLEAAQDLDDDFVRESQALKAQALKAGAV